MKRVRTDVTPSSSSQERKHSKLRASGSSLAELAKRRVAEKRSVSENVSAAASTFFDACSSPLCCGTLLEASSSWDVRVCESFLVARLGLTGVEGLRLANRLLPKQYGTRRNQLAADIINSLVTATGDDTAVTGTDCGVLLAFVEEKCPLYCNLSVADHLRRLSQLKGAPYNEFLAPPVTSCINTECR